MKNQILFGIIQRFKKRINSVVGGYATIVAHGITRQFTASDHCGPFCIEPGDTQPVFNTSKRLYAPAENSEVVMEVMNVNGAQNGIQKVMAWGYASGWHDALRIMATRPTYRVIRENRFRGQLMTGSARDEVVFIGNLQKLSVEFPRDGLRISTVDKMAPLYKTGPISAKNQFQIRDQEMAWKPCEDPRPFPDGQIYRLMYWKDGQHRQLAQCTLAELNWKFPKWENDCLAVYHSIGEAGGYLYWEKLAPAASWCKESWIEIADPRTRLPESKKVPLINQTAAKTFKNLENLNLDFGSPVPAA